MRGGVTRGEVIDVEGYLQSLQALDCRSDAVVAGHERGLRDLDAQSPRRDVRLAQQRSDLPRQV